MTDQDTHRAVENALQSIVDQAEAGNAFPVIVSVLASVGHLLATVTIHSKWHAEHGREELIAEMFVPGAALLQIRPKVMAEGKVSGLKSWTKHLGAYAKYQDREAPVVLATWRRSVEYVSPFDRGLG